jgi:hypothetical protein
LASNDSKYRHPQYRSLAWDLFIEQMHKETGAQALIYDLKIGYFNYVMNYDGADYKTFCLDEKTKIIYLARRNVARMIISRHLASWSNRWFKLSQSPSAEMLDKFEKWRKRWLYTDDSFAKLELKVNIDPAALVRDIDISIAQNEEILRIFGDKISEKFVYEELFDSSGKFDQRVVRTMAQLMQISEESFHPIPILAKQSSEGVLDAIENAEEILRFVHGTKYEWMFESA